MDPISLAEGNGGLSDGCTVNGKATQQRAIWQGNVFENITLNLQPINGLEPTKQQPEETMVSDTGILFSTYRCKECGNEQLVLIRAKKNKPIVPPKCFNRACKNYGYTISSQEQEEFNREHAGKIIDYDRYIQFCVVTKFADDGILCTTVIDPEYIVLGASSLKYASYQKPSLSSSTSISSET